MVKSVTIWVRRSAVVMIILLYSIVCSVPALGSPTFVASRNSDVYHISSCSYVDLIKNSNIIYFESAEAAEASGRRGCSRCNPERYLEGRGEDTGNEEGGIYPIYEYPMFVSTERGTKYHITSCSRAWDIDAEKRKLYYSAERAEKDKKEPCPKCMPDRYLRSSYESLDLSSDDIAGIIDASKLYISHGMVASGGGYKGGYEDGYNTRDAKAMVEVGRAYSSGYQSGAAKVDEARERGFAAGLTTGKADLAVSNKEKYDSGYKDGYADGAESEKGDADGYILTGLGCLAAGAVGAAIFIKKRG